MTQESDSLPVFEFCLGRTGSKLNFSSEEGRSYYNLEALARFTYLPDLQHAFDDRLNETDVQLLTSFLDRSHGLSLGDESPYDVILKKCISRTCSGIYWCKF